MGSTIDWLTIYRRLREDPNDAAAFTALSSRVERWIRAQLWDPTLSLYREDVLADACSSVLVGIDEAYGAETFSSFVYGHYLNARRRALQGRGPVIPLGDIDLPDSPESPPTPDEVDLLQRCLAVLPPRERRAVELRYLGDATTREIAEALGVTNVNARQIVFSGLARLRRSARRAWPLGRG
jgi:RNA polymerase sigma factor (sigma-70 family)